MCGRTACTLDPDQFPKACRFKDENGKVQSPQWRQVSGGQYFPSYNVAPQSHTPVLISSKHVPLAELPKSLETPERILQTMKWGLIPSWFKGEPSEFEYKMNNARSDTLMDKASYRTPVMQGKKCVVLAEGYYEWKTSKEGKKQPYYIYFKTEDAKSELGDVKQPEYKSQRLLTMAGLFDCWKAKGTSDASSDKVLYTYTIITVDASPSVNWIHHRMPAVLDGDDAIRQWLEFEDVPYTKALNLINSVNCLACHPVSSLVNNSRNKSPDCIKPIDLSKPFDSKQPAKGAITSWFIKSPKKEDKTAEQLQSPPKKRQLEAKAMVSKQLQPAKGKITSWFIKSPKKEEKTAEEVHSPSPKKIKIE